MAVAIRVHTLRSYLSLGHGWEILKHFRSAFNILEAQGVETLPQGTPLSGSRLVLEVACAPSLDLRNTLSYIKCTK